MTRGLPIIVLGSFLLIGGSVALAEDAIPAPGTDDANRGTSGLWVGSVKFTAQTTESHVEHGDLEPDASSSGTLPGNYDAAMRRLAAETATIQASPCDSGSDCAPAVLGEYQSSERSDAKRQSRWPRSCPGGATQAQSVRSVLSARQVFRNKRGPAPARLIVSWDQSRKIWTVDAGLLSGAAAPPVCDDIASEVDSVDPGCGAPTVPPKTTRLKPSPAACAAPTMGQTFTIDAPPDVTHLSGSHTFESSKTPDNPPSGAVKLRNGSVAVERTVIYNLTRIDSPPSD